ncbi:hypothetical protein C1645_768673 [Glomus cerebriforme]|uniref:Uncharacterized protein n=1 Tax=Glomus cerebriforme TaxID=658196 RepID=A0A397T3U2_9GLOM|nr:hypothetical protein C1645_768673 [Glomus cerebriforme]
MADYIIYIYVYIIYIYILNIYCICICIVNVIGFFPFFLTKQLDAFPEIIKKKFFKILFYILTGLSHTVLVSEFVFCCTSL